MARLPTKDETDGMTEVNLRLDLRFYCIWISLIIRDGRPRSGYGLHSFPAYRSH
jgi:hypothetical protein